MALLTIILLTVNLLYNQYSLAFINFLVILLLVAPALALQWQRKYQQAAYVLIAGLMIITIFGVWEGLRIGNFTDAENLYIGYLLLAIVLLDGRPRIISMILSIIILVFFKTEKYLLMEQKLGKDYILELTNTTMLTSFSAYIVWVFKGSSYKALEQSNEQRNIVYSLIDNLPLFIGMLDKNGRYIVVNKQYELAFNKEIENILGRHYSEILPEKILSNHEKYVEMTMKGLSPSFSEKLELPDYSDSYVSGKYYPVYGEDGQIRYVTVYVSDVTELKETEKALSNANKTKSELFSIVSHDLRSPLALLLNVISVTEMESMTKEEFSVFLQEMKKKLKALLGTVDNVLSWAKSQLDQIVSEPEKVSINDSIAEVIMLHSEKAIDKGLEVVFEPQKDYTVVTDKNHLNLVLRNIFHNSLKFTEQGRVKFEVLEDHQNTTILIKDTGVGMDPATIEKLLNPDSIESKAGTRGEMGTGLGMSMSVRLLEMNNCPLEIESVPGKGSVFKIIIPR